MFKGTADYSLAVIVPVGGDQRAVTVTNTMGSDIGACFRQRRNLIELCEAGKIGG